MRKTHWTIEKITEGFERFRKNHNRYPSSYEIDQCTYLPSSRHIQRLYKEGIPGIRKLIDKNTTEANLTHGKYSSKRAQLIINRGAKVREELYRYLIERFKKEHVFREHFFVDDRRNRVDFYIECENGNFCVDTIYPENTRTLTGCINGKLKTYRYFEMLPYKLIFVVMNDSIQEGDIEKMIKNKKRRIPEKQDVMTKGNFLKYCEKKIAK